MNKKYYEYPDVLDVADIKHILGIGRKQAYELVNSKSFHVIRVGKRIKVSKNVLFNWIEGSKEFESTPKN